MFKVARHIDGNYLLDIELFISRWWRKIFHPLPPREKPECTSPQYGPRMFCSYTDNRDRYTGVCRYCGQTPDSVTHEIRAEQERLIKAGWTAHTGEQE